MRKVRWADVHSIEYTVGPRQAAQSASTLRTKYFLRRDDRVAVDRDCILNVSRVAPRISDHRRDAPCSRYSEYQFVALLQSFNRQRKPSELILAIRIGSRYVAH